MRYDTTGLGRRPDLAAELEQLGDASLTPGRVLAQHRGRWLVAPASAMPASGGEPPSETATSKTAAPETASEPTTPEPRLLPARGRLRGAAPVTGDWVAIDADGAIAAVLERRGTLTRRAVGEPTAAQVLAANVDLALIAEALPEPNEGRIERMAALALADDVAAALVLTKADLEPDAHLIAPQIARRLGLADAVAVSVRDGDGLAILRTLLEPGATAVLLGPSGAGKSTLVNTLLDEQRQATAPVRAGDGRGRHTTVTRELIPLPGGALLVDTPGLREVALWDGAGTMFDDVERLAAACRFADCQHDSEPGCAVRDAVDPDRLATWRKFEAEQARLDDRKAAARERELRGKHLSRQVKEAQEIKRRQ
jgi:ribosome biogenesis GTPase / thiamine phosphate phosphatase